ncbi:MAG TPA: alanine racemase [Planctomycetota bacterium]
MPAAHRAWAEIDLGAFRANLALARRIAGRAEVWPVLKANGYGHGARTLARTCAAEGVSRLGVGDSGEALELRDAGVRVPLLVLGTVIDAEVPDLLHHGIEVGVHSESRVRKLAAAAGRAGVRLGVHLKIDTGMARLGVRPEAALRVARAIAAEPALVLRGLMTHFSSLTGASDPCTADQLMLFLAGIDELRAAGIAVPAVHCANSAALFTGLQPLGDAVRPGLALYGMLPAAAAARSPYANELQPVLSLRAQIVFLKDVPAGAPVGYGSLWRAPRPTRLAILPIGYADGVPWRAGREVGARVLVRGCPCPLVGAVSMDYCTVDVTDVPGVETGAVATLIGRDGAARVDASELAAAAGTSPYELTCSLGSRVRRVYCEAPAPHTAMTAAR